MTKRRPKRDKNGKFIARGQTPREKPRPDTCASDGGIIERPDAPYIPQGGERYVIVQGGRGGGKTASQEAMLEGKEKVLVVMPPKRRCCEECGEELTYTWMHSGRAVYHVGRCMRCNPEPPILVKE